MDHQLFSEYLEKHNYVKSTCQYITQFNESITILNGVQLPIFFHNRVVSIDSENNYVTVLIGWRVLSHLLLEPFIEYLQKSDYQIIDQIMHEYEYIFGEKLINNKQFSKPYDVPYEKMKSYSDTLIFLTNPNKMLGQIFMNNIHQLHKHMEDSVRINSHDNRELCPVYKTKYYDRHGLIIDIFIDIKKGG